MSASASPPITWSRIARRIRVPLGFGFAAFYLWRARPSWASLAVGAVIALLGIFIRAVASGHVEKNRVLAITGPYAYVRNPLYLGSIIIGIGFTDRCARLVGPHRDCAAFRCHLRAGDSFGRSVPAKPVSRSTMTTRAACPACFPTRCCSVKSPRGSRASYTAAIANTIRCWALRPCWRRLSLRSSGFPG